MNRHERRAARKRARQNKHNNDERLWIECPELTGEDMCLLAEAFGVSHYVLNVEQLPNETDEEWGVRMDKALENILKGAL